MRGIQVIALRTDLANLKSEIEGVSKRKRSITPENLDETWVYIIWCITPISSFNSLAWFAAYKARPTKTR